ncbi:HNH endonuclease [Myxococcota bacterium]|nr:HNH endonuclease [Myxococcota bacterium]
MRAFVGVTDGDWFQLLSSRPNLEEVNFWQPGGQRHFRALAPGELFLFKLHSPRNFIVGGGLFAHSTLLPMSLAWEAFQVANGALTAHEMRRRIERYRRTPEDKFADYTIGCILLEQPFFLDEREWIPVPSDWKSNIVQGRTYDLAVEPGLSLWAALEARRPTAPPRQADRVEDRARFGAPVQILPRLGQGSFRVLVTDAYERRCTVTHEKTLPVLQAAHIQPYAAGGEHRIDNGLLLRSDLHTLFDRGYVTVTPEHRVEVSRRIREEFENGRHYYALHGSEIRVPDAVWQRPGSERLRWHNENVYRG